MRLHAGENSIRWGLDLDDGFVGFDVEKRLIDLVGEDDTTGSFKSVSITDYARVAHADMKIHADGKPRVGVVVASGEILDGDQPPGTVGGDSTARLIRQARLDKNIKAQGGSGLADMVTMTVFITDARLGDRFIELRKQAFKNCFPASALITITGLAQPGLLIEIEGTAVVGGK